MGLGNYPEKFRFTYHNIGYLSLDYIVKKLNRRWRYRRDLKTKLSWIDDVLICKPFTYINLSGEVVRRIMERYSIEAEDLLVICDDLQLDFGIMKLKSKGGDGGHRGLFSLIDSLGTENFPRLRIGIDRPADSSEFKDYVLKTIPPQELKRFREEVFPLVFKTFITWKENSLNKAMTFVNSLN